MRGMDVLVHHNTNEDQLEKGGKISSGNGSATMGLSANSKVLHDPK